MKTIQDILLALPHRYPFLLIDRVLEFGNGKVHALKNVTINEPFFNGHFPQYPVMPGVLLIEAMAQAGVFLLEEGREPGQIAFLAGVDEARFKRQVIPGDQLHIHAELEFFRRGIGKMKAEIRVDNELAASAIITFALAR
ncbi:3-hydroxyacyl-ACP dehydratase FabZ [Deinococcus cellulosilyticus]|uniref:3-hydroxyacyl-[acyl-carrier-protein] dehydratase FabZ n=1 Tax=Deinococcus cellulosilyticus (strain DSM 18568 / NBRC 106333 / KACC 11606 / 5516J-15) TaxID=1223518 RepID=A0A511MXD2_DEIC1|nr:3-hydroxyacyl-ACP dehydratase FabZ [Deinococcus cellulosilyticus]GEM45021.1 3-hydroxyacyl-[acyl-carrier-protein] dehydratase FabZ [Deinococcus cellulosilyticus NBRC 106333 = KACC 11606]